MFGADLLSISFSLIQERKSESEDDKSEAIFQCSVLQSACKNANIEDKFEYFLLIFCTHMPEKVLFFMTLFVYHQLHNGVKGVSYFSVDISHTCLSV